MATITPCTFTKRIGESAIRQGHKHYAVLISAELLGKPGLGLTGLTFELDCTLLAATLAITNCRRLIRTVTSS